MSAAEEMLHTIYNEILNNHWTFDDQEIQRASVDNLELHVHLRDKVIKIKVSETANEKKQRRVNR